MSQNDQPDDNKNGPRLNAKPVLIWLLLMAACLPPLLLPWCVLWCGVVRWVLCGVVWCSAVPGPGH